MISNKKQANQEHTSLDRGMVHSLLLTPAYPFMTGGAQMERKHRASVIWQFTVWLLLTAFFAIPIILSNLESMQHRIPCKIYILLPKG